MTGTRRMDLRRLVLLALASLPFALGCEEPSADTDAAVPVMTGTEVEVVVYELGVYDACDGADDPGDFYIDAVLGGGQSFYEYVLDETGTRVVLAYAETIETAFAASARVPHEDGYAFDLEVSFYERDPNDERNAYGSTAWTFTWDEARACWQDQPFGPCFAEGSFLPDFVYSSQGSVARTCRGHLGYELSFTEVEAPVASFFEGEWDAWGGSQNGMLTLNRVERGEGGDESAGTCDAIYDNAIDVDADASPEIVGGGGCEISGADWVADGTPVTWRVDARFVSTTEIEGRIELMVGDEPPFSLPVTAVRTDDPGVEVFRFTVLGSVPDLFDRGSFDLHVSGEWDLGRAY